MRSERPRHPHALTRLAGRLGLGGRPFAAPGVLDRLVRGWYGVPPRLRTVIMLVAVLALLTATRIQVRQAELRWGGPPVTAWVAEADTGVGEVAVLRRVRLPPDAVPTGALSAATDEPLTMALPEGAVVTAGHVSASGPAVGLPGDARLVPIPVDPGWGITAGAQVDVWVDDGGTGTTLVAAGRPVVDVRDTGSGAGRATALVSMARDQVPAVTAALAQGAVLLSLVPDR